jgi:hypothetical protein
MEFLTRSLGCIAICATGSLIAMHRRLEIYGWGTAKHRTPAEVLVLGDLLEKSQGGNRSDRFENLLKPRVLTQFASVSWADTRHFEGLSQERVEHLGHPTCLWQITNMGSNIHKSKGKPLTFPIPTFPILTFLFTHTIDNTGLPGFSVY